MDNTALYITLWVASGAFIGGVITPLVVAEKRFSDFLAMLLGTVVGAVVHVVGLLPLWGLLWLRAGEVNDTRLAWQRDDAVAAGTAGQAYAAPARKPAGSLSAILRENFWPKPRTEGHSHRMTYVGVAAALAVTTAVEVGLTFIDASWIVGPLVALSTLKVLLVAGYFMHLIYDSKWYTAVFVVTLPFAAMLMIVLALS